MQWSDFIAYQPHLNISTKEEKARASSTFFFKLECLKRFSQKLTNYNNALTGFKLLLKGNFNKYFNHINYCLFEQRSHLEWYTFDSEVEEMWPKIKKKTRVFCPACASIGQRWSRERWLQNYSRTDNMSVIALVGQLMSNCIGFSVSRQIRLLDLPSIGYDQQPVGLFLQFQAGDFVL